MIRLRTVTMKNFLSVGANTQSVRLDDHGLTLVVGENIDLGSEGARNGVGKTTMIQAICYAMFGEPLTKIKVNNLINKINKKNMMVTLDFDVDGKGYRVERGRSPNFCRWYVNDGLVNAPESDEAHGESKWTQTEINKVFGMSHDLFRHIVAPYSKMVPFLSLRDKEQRDLIEELLTITKLSSKAEQLKDLIKDIKNEIKDEELRIKLVTDGNAKTQKHINDLRFQQTLWDNQHQKKLDKLEKAIEQLAEIDIETEIENHRILGKWLALSNEASRLERDLIRIERTVTSAESNLSRIREQIKSTEAKACPTCGGDLHDDQHETILAEYRKREEQYLEDKKNAEEEMFSVAPVLEEKLTELAALGNQPAVSYDSMEDALNHRHTLDKLRSDLDREQGVDNPYVDQIANLSTAGLQEISYEYVKELTRLKEHQDYLYKLLTSKDSFIRKKIIDQNLTYLNVRLNHYLEQLNLPHEVVFMSDLSVEITKKGLPYDFEGLSNGEANRLVLAMSWAFRDVWESQNQHLNLLMIDELVDTGMDDKGMDLALDILKKSARERGKNIFLVSHKSDLSSRVSRILLVQKENDFTSYITDVENING